MATEVNATNSNNHLYDTLTKKKNQTNASLSVENFLQLIATQMSNQDPMNPSSETDFMAQMAQFTALQATENMSLQTGISYAASLVGKDVTAAKILQNGDLVKSEGKVSGVSFFEGAPVIYIDGEAYWLDQIMAVGALPEPVEPDPDPKPDPDPDPDPKPDPDPDPDPKPEPHI